MMSSRFLYILGGSITEVLKAIGIKAGIGLVGLIWLVILIGVIILIYRTTNNAIKCNSQDLI